MNDVTVQETGTAVAEAGYNYFEAYGAQASQNTLVGQLLKFSKGDWLAGQGNTELKPGTKLVALMDQLQIGWVKWEDNKPTEQLMGLVIEGYKPMHRKDLGDLDESLWEVDMQGKPRDPWQRTNYLVLRDVGVEDVTDEDRMYTFTTSSKGGIGAVVKLCNSYGKAMRQHPDEYPVVELKVDSYAHPIKEYGRIKTPVLELVGWEAKVPVSSPDEKKAATRRGK